MNGIGCMDTIGLDLGDKFSYAHVLDADGETVERFNLRTTPRALNGRLGKRTMARIVIETGTHSPWISRQLANAGHQVIVANAREVALISKGKKKTDRRDAELLARLGRADPTLLSPIQHKGADSQADLAVLRARRAAVRARTQLVNCCRGQVKSMGSRLPSCSTPQFHVQARTAVPEELRPALEPLLDQIEQLTKAIKGYDKQINQLCKKHAVTDLLQKVPGVGPLASLTYVLTLEDPRRFRRSRQVGAYLGLVPRLDESGDSKKQLRITKAGDVDLRRLLVISAQYILGPWGPDCDLRRWGLAMTERGARNSKKRAVVAVARRLAVLLHRLWLTGEDYDPLFLARQRGEADDPDLARPPKPRKKSPAA